MNTVQNITGIDIDWEEKPQRLNFPQKTKDFNKQKQNLKSHNC
jgi:hypothetical protein